MKTINHIVILLALGVIGACQYNFPEPQADSTGNGSVGGADFSKYLAFGNSITAGFMDASLYLEGQNSSYAKLIHDRLMGANPNMNQYQAYHFKSSTGTETTTGIQLGSTGPVVHPGSTSAYRGNLFYNYKNGDSSSICELSGFPMVSDIAPTNSFPFVEALPSTNPLTNFGFPALAVATMNNATASAMNPYYRAIGTATPVVDAVAQAPTFFTFWMVSNDILGYAAAGGVGNEPNVDAGNYFTLNMEAALDSLLASTANTKGMVANIPNFLQTPYFAYNESLFSGRKSNVSAEGIPIYTIADSATLNEINSFYTSSGYNFDQEAQFTIGVNYPRYLKGTTVKAFKPGQDHFLLPMSGDQKTDSVGIGIITDCKGIEEVGRPSYGGMGFFTANAVDLSTGKPRAYPVPDKYILDSDEAAKVTEQINKANTHISNIVTARKEKLILVDMHAAFEKAINNSLGGVINGTGQIVMYTNPKVALGPAGMFSLDGLHPTPKGQAHIANVFIEAMNASYSGTNLSTYDLTNYRGAKFVEGTTP